MGLLTKITIIKWRKNTKRHYEERGYVCTKLGDEFKCDVEDLTNGSHVLVEVKCDCPDCKNPYLKPITWKNYLRHVHMDGKYYCKKCGYKLFATEKVIKTRLRKGKSFAQWCMENNRQDILNRWDYDLNECKPSEVTFTSQGFNKRGYWFKCPRGIHKSELKNIGSFTGKQNCELECNQCNSFGQYLLDTYGENALDSYWSDKNTENPFEIAKMRNKPKVFIKCQNTDYHEDYPVSCAHFVIGNRCPYCAGNQFGLHPKDSLGQYLEDNGLLHLWSDENEKSPFEYSCCSTKEAWWKCSDNKHEDFYRNISGSKNKNFRCPTCVEERRESFLQEKVRLYLESLNIYTILHERKCTIIPKNPKVKSNRNTMPFDNEIKELNLIIEVHGQQHYEISGWNELQSKHNKTTPEYELHMQQVRDRYKKIYAYIKGYHYLEIPYWTDNAEEEWKQLIDYKIQEILSQS